MVTGRWQGLVIEMLQVLDPLVQSILRGEFTTSRQYPALDLAE